MQPQVENFSSYQSHAKSPPSYEQCMMIEEGNSSNHSRTCQQAIALFLLLFLIVLIFCWIALLLDGSQEYKDSHNYHSTSSTTPSFKAIQQYRRDPLTLNISGTKWWSYMTAVYYILPKKLWKLMSYQRAYRGTLMYWEDFTKQRVFARIKWMNTNCLIVLISIGGKISLKPLNHSVGNMMVVELVFNGHRLKRKRREEKNC